MVVRCYDLQAGTSAGKSVEQCRRLPQAYAEAGIECLELPLNDRCVHGHRCDHNCEHGCEHDEKLAPAIAAAEAFVPPSSRRTTGVLVHCGAGVSRSASVLAALLMRPSELGCSYPQALALIRAARPIVGPNPGFSQQLREISTAEL